MYKSARQKRKQQAANIKHIKKEKGEVIVSESYYIILTFVEHTPHSFFLWQQPVVEARHLFEVCTSADKKQPEDKDAIEWINYGKGKVALYALIILENLRAQSNNHSLLFRYNQIHS